MGKKILFRALNKNDLILYYRGRDIYCNKVINMSKNNKITNDNLFAGKYWEYLDDTYAHVGGEGINDSSLISLSSDFDFVVTEYAIPQAGKFNKCPSRKPVALFVFDDNQIISNANDLNNIRYENVSENYIIDLTNNKLIEYVENRAIWPKELKHDENNNIVFGKPKGFSGYSTNASEYVAINSISHNSIQILISPIMQDILYGLNKSFMSLIREEEYANFIAAISPYVEEFLDSYPTFLRNLYGNIKSGINLTDFVFENYSVLPFKTLEENYEIVKELKKRDLNQLIEYVKLYVDLSPFIKNGFTKNDLRINRLVDDKIYVANFNNIDKSHFSKAGLNDILLIEYDGTVFKYNPINNEYETALSSISYETIKKHCGYKK